MKFVDFDWAGKVGDARYPVMMNPEVNWHLNAFLGKLILPEHDHYLLESEFEGAETPKRPRLN